MNRTALSRFAVLLLSFSICTASSLADQVEMQNGDRYIGKVLSLNDSTLVLQNEVLGTVRLPRGKVALITLGPVTAVRPVARPAATNHLAQAAIPGITNSVAGAGGVSPELSSILGQLGTSSNLVKQVQSRFLSGAGSEANGKFNEMLDGLVSGKMSMTDLRAQAQSAADQLRAAKKDLGDDAGWGLDSYLAILDHFLNETAPPGGTPTNSMPLR